MMGEEGKGYGLGRELRHLIGWVSFENKGTLVPVGP